MIVPHQRLVAVDETWCSDGLCNPLDRYPLGMKSPVLIVKVVHRTSSKRISVSDRNGYYFILNGSVQRESGKGRKVSREERAILSAKCVYLAISSSADASGGLGGAFLPHPLTTVKSER
jgi:hypothetical protein